MASSILGSGTVTFGDTTVQNTAGLPLAQAGLGMGPGINPPTYPKQIWWYFGSSGTYRSLGVTYTNTLNYPIGVCVATQGSGVVSASGYVDGTLISQFYANAFSGPGTQIATVTLIVPSGSTYEATSSNALLQWCEMY